MALSRPKRIVERQLGHAHEPVTALPGVLDALQAGAVSPRHMEAIVGESLQLTTDANAATTTLRAAEHAGTPEPILSRLRDEAERLRALVVDDERTALSAAAGRSPKSLRERCRVLAARLLGRSADERMQQARADRCVYVVDLGDSTSELRTVLPSEIATAIHERLSAQARALTNAAPEEPRSLDQLRADLAADLLLVSDPSTLHASARDIRANITVTVPVLSMLGTDTHPVTMDGVVPIPMRDARRYAAGQPIWLRALTDPVSGTVLAVDTYRPAARLRAQIEAQSPTWVFPACHRPARDCDLDHRTAWTDGGTTSADNLQPLCPSDHTVKHLPGWRVERDPGDSTATIWTTPTGLVARTTPPPLGPAFVEAPPPPPDEEPPPF